MTNQGNPSSIAPSASGISIAESNGSVEDEIEELQKSFVFPLFSEMSRTVVMPPFFCFLQYIIQIFQSLVANMFIGNHHIWKSISSTPKVLRYFSYIINFGVIDRMNRNNTGASDDEITNDDFFNCWPIYISFIVYFVIEFIFFLIILTYYKKKRTFLKWTLYLTNFFLNILNQVVFVPACSLSGYAVWQIDRHQSTSSIVYLLITLIPVFLLLFVIIYNSTFSCNSICLSRSIDSCWNPKIKSIFTITIGVTSFLGPAINPFSRWFVFVGLILSIVLNVYQLYLMYYLPYLKEVMNIIIQSACILSIIESIITCVHYYKNVNKIVHIVVPLAIFVFFCVLYYFFDKFKIKRILQKLDVQNENITEKEKKEFLELINFGSNEMIMFYIRIGIAYLSPLCVDFSVMKFIYTLRNTPDIVFPLIQITAMFPAQMQFMSLIMGPFNKKGLNLSITQNFIIYQARKINIIRNSVSSKAERKASAVLFKMSEESISLVRGFWKEIAYLKSSVSTASLRYFRNIANRTSSSYLDALNQYPKSQKIYDQYIRFLLEAKGDFKGSIHYMKNMLLIERGKHVVNDSAFKSFVNVYPKYLTEHIVDNHGYYINKNDKLQSNEYMTNNSSNISTSDFHDDEIASSLFNHSKLRISLQTIINKSSIKSLNILRVFSFVALILIALVMIILFVVISSTSDDLHNFVKSISLNSKILTNIQHAQLIIGTRYLEYQSRYSFYNELDYEKIGFLFDKFCIELGIENTSLSEEPSIFNEPYVKLNMLINEIRSLVSEEMVIIFSNPSKHSGEIALLGEWSEESGHRAYYNFNGRIGIVIPLSLSLKGIMDVVLKQFDYLSSRNVTSYDYQSFSYNDVNYYLISCYNGILIGQNFDILFQNISQRGVNDCEKYSEIYDILTYLISILVFIIFFVGRLINFILVVKEFRNLTNLLKGFNRDEMAEFSKPIYLKGKDRLPTGTVHSSHDFSIEMVAIPFIFLLITADCIFVVVFSCINTQNYFDKFSNFFEWANGAAQRASTILKLVIAFHIEIQANYYQETQSNETKGENMVKNLEQIIKFQNLIDLEIIGNDNRFDNFYYSSHCDGLNESYDFADFSDCLSVSNKLNLIIGMLNMMKKSYYYYDLFKSYEYAALMYNIDKSIINEFISLLDYLISLSKKISDEHNDDVKFISIIGIVILFVLFFIENIFISMLYNSLDGFKQLIYTVPPLSIYHNNDLMNFLFGKKSKIISETAEEIVVNSSQLGIVSINENLIIQSINPVFNKMTDISPQKLLGQSITFLIPVPTDENEKIAFDKSHFYCSINEMKNNFSDKDVYTIKLKIRKEDESYIHVNADLIKVVDSFNQFKGVNIVMKSIKENFELKNLLQQEKIQTNNLLNILIPSGALNTVKGKKNSFFFKSDEASLIFIEMIGMDEYISSMSPKAMMEVLESIYNEIDKTLKKHKTISMIHWENDMIFAVSGLFDTIGDFKKQAYESVCFLNEIVQGLEEINIQSSTDFHMRLGAHIGGPVMGFIQDPNNPTFDVRSATFKYINFMKENGPLDVPQFTASLVKHLDANALEATQISTFTFDEINEGIFSVSFKEGYKPNNEENEENKENAEEDQNDGDNDDDKETNTENNGIKSENSDNTDSIISDKYNDSNSDKNDDKDNDDTDNSQDVNVDIKDPDKSNDSETDIKESDKSNENNEVPNVNEKENVK